MIPKVVRVPRYPTHDSPAYAHDPAAADATIALIERYLAEFRQIVVTDNDLLSNIRQVLQAFVDAGWPAAITLAYRWTSHSTDHDGNIDHVAIADAADPAHTSSR
jgi:hypothetical protein